MTYDSKSKNLTVTRVKSDNGESWTADGIDICIEAQDEETRQSTIAIAKLLASYFAGRNPKKITGDAKECELDRVQSFLNRKVTKLDQDTSAEPKADKKSV